MAGVIGIFLTFAMVFGGFAIAGGHITVILYSLPYEMMMIGGAAIGSFLLSNETSVIKHAVIGIGKSLRGSKWTSDDMRDTLCLLFQLLRMARGDPLEIEIHIEDANSSPIFQQFPRILSETKAVDLITDTLRSGSLNYDDPYQVEEMLSHRISLMKDEAMHAPHALQSMADALPALGIVAAVLGVIKTMSSIDQPPEVLGTMIGGALVGTFLGVFLAYAIVAPFAQRLLNVIKQDLSLYDVIKSVLVAGLHQHSTNLCVEVGRQAAPEHIRPSYGDVENALREIKRVS